MAYLCIFFAVIAVWQLGIRYHRAQRLKELSKRSTAEFGELKRQLTNRHVIVTHLADSIPKSFDPKFERQRLREISLATRDVRLCGAVVESGSDGKATSIRRFEMAIKD